jgi:hypothetical protein
MQNNEVNFLVVFNFLNESHSRLLFTFSTKFSLAICQATCKFFRPRESTVFRWQLFKRTRVQKRTAALRSPTCCPWINTASLPQRPIRRQHQNMEVSTRRALHSPSASTLGSRLFFEYSFHEQLERALVEFRRWHRETMEHRNGQFFGNIECNRGRRKSYRIWAGDVARWETSNGRLGLSQSIKSVVEY